MAAIDRLNPFVHGIVRRFTNLGAAFAPCLPDWLRRHLAAPDPELLVVPDTAGTALRARLYLAAGEIREPLGGLGLLDQDPLPPLVAERARHAQIPPLTRLILPPEQVLRRRVSLPAQVRPNLARVIHDEIDRLSPFQSAAVLYDFMVHPGPARAPRIQVELALCRRDTAAGWIARLRDAGAPISGIFWEGAWPQANLLPPAERPRRRRVVFTVERLLMVLTLFLLIATLVTPIWQRSRILADLERDVRGTRTQAVAVDDLRQELERARHGSTVVIQQKLEQPRLLDLLRELTDVLSDETWIQTLDYNQGEIELRGESAQATALIALLEQAPGIDDVAFRSPVTQVPRTGRERFNLAFRFTRVAPP